MFRVIAAYLGWEALHIVTVNLRHHSFSNIDDLGAKVFEMGLTVSDEVPHQGGGENIAAKLMSKLFPTHRMISSCA